jgi:hypothetical protein
MKVSQFVTKIVVRVFFILMGVAAFAYFQGDQTKLQHIYFSFHSKWQMVFPIILIVSFISLLIICAVKKYNETDLNWLLVLNTVILLIYSLAIYVRIFHML